MTYHVHAVLRAFFPEVPGLQLEQVELQETVLIAYLRATRSTARCPCCQGGSHPIHSHYTRPATDSSLATYAVRLVFTVRQFFCRHPQCPQRIFAERLPTVVAPRARKTTRLIEVHCLVAFALGGEAGARLLARLGRPTSPDTLLALMRRTPLPERACSPALGIDDWSFRQGGTFGTIGVDLERHCPVDLLPDRSSESVAAWFATHPGIDGVARDRSGGYADGVTRGAPAATQVADRWHLLKSATRSRPNQPGRDWEGAAFLHKRNDNYLSIGGCDAHPSW